MDFQPLKLELHFDPNFGSPRQCGCIHIIDDSIDEENESFSVHIYSITFCVELIGTTTADVTILDNDGKSLKLNLIASMVGIHYSSVGYLAKIYIIALSGSLDRPTTQF